MDDFNLKCEKCGKEMREKEGRFGKFLACSGFPACRNTKKINDDGTIGKQERMEIIPQKCDKCGAPMVRKNGRFGPFFSCSKYPACKNIKNIQITTGVTCPECNSGEIVQRRSRLGKVFYSCNKYPDCKFALWSKPTGNKCPECGKLMIVSKENHERCSDQACKFEREIEAAK
ncbi:MAG: topoisomerase DNA-binding C4 zinc finger domain-containing protein [Patescibacteria group bacterium]